jgi:peroxiredoxin
MEAIFAAWFRSRMPAGAAAPDFALPRFAGGGEVRLSGFRGHRPVVLAFGSFG